MHNIISIYRNKNKNQLDKGKIEKYETLHKDPDQAVGAKGIFALDTQT